MIKLFLLVSVLLSFNVFADECDDMYTYIQQRKDTIDLLAFEVHLQALDVGSYGISLQDTPEYLDAKSTYDILAENYDAVVNSHNQVVWMYQANCENR